MQVSAQSRMELLCEGSRAAITRGLDEYGPRVQYSVAHEVVTGRTTVTLQYLFPGWGTLDPEWMVASGWHQRDRKRAASQIPL